MRTLVASLRYAWRGIRTTFRHEQNFRIQLFAASVALLLALLLQVDLIDAVAIIFVCTAVLVLEILNSVVERFIDLLKPRMEHQSGLIKDMMAAAVLLTSCGALVVGMLIFYPYVFSG